MNNILKIIGIIVIIFFLSLYFSRYSNNYYEDKTNLTEKAIEKYEKDLKEGKKIDPNNYIVEEKNYNNKASTIGLKASKFIENTFSYGLKHIMKYLNQYE